MPSIRITAFKSVYDALSKEDKLELNEALALTLSETWKEGLMGIEVYWLPPIDGDIARNTCSFNVDIQFSTSPPNPEGVPFEDDPTKKLDELVNALKALLKTSKLPPGTDFGIWPFGSAVALFGFDTKP